MWRFAAEPPSVDTSSVDLIESFVESNVLRGGLYLAASALCLYAAFLERRRSGGHERVFWFWLALGALLLLLGVGRFGDLGPWFTDQGRELAESQGWYDERRRFQSRAVELVIFAGGVAILFGVAWFFRSVSREHPLAFIAIAFLVTYVAVRAISWHTADAILYSHPFGGPHPNGIIEIAATLLMCVAAAWAVLALSQRSGDTFSAS